VTSLQCRRRSGDAALWLGVALAIGFLASVIVGIAVAEGPHGHGKSDGPESASRAAYTLTLAADGRSIALTGLIDFGLTRDLAELLEAAPEAGILRLESAGGRVAEARGVAGLVHRHDLATSARAECSSACTLVLLAAERRFLEPGARLGFHRYGLRSPLVGIFLDPAAEQARDVGLFRGQEVAAEFLERVAATPHDEMWFPSPTELLDAGVIDAIGRPR
jgi:hypothetical protein